jgi:LPS export ABC transporter protein LptC
MIALEFLKMLSDFGRYSRFILFLKTALGLASSIIFITLIFYSSNNRTTSSVENVSKDVKIGLKYQAYKTRIKGFTKDGSEFDFYAKSLDPSKKDPNTVFITEPKGLIYFPDKEKVNFSSEIAVLSVQKERLVFQGQLKLSDSNGNFFETDRLTADFKEKFLIASSQIKTITSFGSINSGGLKYFYGSKTDVENDNIAFINGVNFEFFVNDTD